MATHQHAEGLQGEPGQLAPGLHGGVAEGLVRQINERWSIPGWTPILYDPSDDFPRSVATLRGYDVLLVNPVRDGLNLVAKKGPLVNERYGVLALSRESGAWAELGGAALGLNPFDVTTTANVLQRALSMTPTSAGPTPPPCATLPGPDAGRLARRPDRGGGVSPRGRLNVSAARTDEPRGQVRRRARVGCCRGRAA